MKYDAIIIGGGPAGMMAAGRAGELGLKVLVLEKNQEVGKKLLLTGKGRCNLTNLENNLFDLVEKYGKNGKFLFSAFSRFSPEKTIKFFESQGLTTKIEDKNRVFPVSNRSLDVRQTLLNYLKKSEVEILFNAKVKNIFVENDKNKISKIVLKNGETFSAKKYVLATGGKSYPITGSTGDGYEWLEILGHTFKKPTPALAPIICTDKFIKDLEGLSLSVQVTLFQNDKKIEQKFGDFIFTKNGLSGPVILNMSKEIGECLHKGETRIKIDFFSQLNFQDLDLKLQKHFQENNNKNFKNILADFLPNKFISTFLSLLKIEAEKKVNSISKKERQNLVDLLKNFSLQVEKLADFDKAMITSGGVKLSEVDSKTMQSKIVENLFFAGEILDVDGPTGGYNLQICWSTGFVVGESLSKF